MRRADKLMIAALVLDFTLGISLNYFLGWLWVPVTLAMGFGAAGIVFANVVYEEYLEGVLKGIKGVKKTEDPWRNETLQIGTDSRIGNQQVAEPKPHDLEVGSRPSLPEYCPMCGGRIKASMDECAHCHYDLTKLKEEYGVKASAGSTEITIDEKRLPVKAYDFCNGLVAFIANDLQATDLRMERAKRMVPEGKISLAKFSEWIREQEAEVEAIIKKGEGKLKEIEEWRKAFNNRTAYARGKLDDASLDALNPASEEEVIRSKKNLFELELIIADKMLRWLEELEIRIRILKDGLESKLRQAYISAIPEEKMAGSETTAIVPMQEVTQA